MPRIGTKTSKGTKVFALAGKIRRAGLIEIPMGTTLRQIVEEIGGGVAAGARSRRCRSAGPPAVACQRAWPTRRWTMSRCGDIGAIMGSGGMVVLDDTACMVDIARYFLQFTQNQSCGKCTFCRIGTKRMLELLERLCAGKASRKHLQELEQLAPQVSQGSLCGLGKTAPNPVLTTLRYFRDEYEAHLQGRCPAGKCKALIKYRVRENCTGCTLCAQHCPVDAIPMTPYARHVIDSGQVHALRLLPAGVSVRRGGGRMTSPIDTSPLTARRSKPPQGRPSCKRRARWASPSPRSATSRALSLRLPVFYAR